MNLFVSYNNCLSVVDYHKNRKLGIHFFKQTVVCITIQLIAIIFLCVHNIYTVTQRWKTPIIDFSEELLNFV